MNPAVKRNFYRKCKEDIDWYLANNSKEDYAMLYRLLGSPASSKFVNFEGKAAEELLKELRMYFANKMNGKPCPPPPGPGPHPGPCPPPPIPIHDLVKILEAIFTKANTRRPGLIRIATDEEALDLRARDIAITPHTLELVLREKCDTYQYDQTIASDIWEINHNLGKFPSVTVVDSAGNMVETEVQYIDKNNCVVLTNGKFKGTAYLN